MMPREDFLTRLFARLDERGVGYCVARNFDTVFTDGASDVDLIALDPAAVRAACDEAASASGFALVQVARLVNHAWTFLHENGALVRIDVDTEVRWRCFHVLGAEEVLAARRRGGHFFVPAPEHEAAILRAQIAWRGEVPGRYARRLAELGAAVPTAAGARFAIALRSLGHPLAVLRYAAADVERFFDRSLGALGAGPVREPGASVVLAGLDGAGKTTFARALIAAAARSPRFAGTRYFHWIPSPVRHAEFPWPAEREIPRREPPPRHALAIAMSAARLLRNLLRAHLGFALAVRPLVRRGWLVVLDRYVTNYWLDPASVRYSGPARWLDWAEPCFPKATLLITLTAGAATLRARKGELSDGQIAEQSERLRHLPALAERHLDLDASLPVETLVARALDALLKL